MAIRYTCPLRGTPPCASFVKWSALLAFATFIRAHCRFLVFGLALAAMSSFGQTFFVALYSGEIRSAFALDHAQFGLLYSGMTILSGFSMLLVGRLVDRVPLRVYVIVVITALAVGAALMAIAVHLIMIGAAIYLLRLCGQGLLSHGAVTSMARYFDRERGRAIAVASLGFPLGESVLPVVGVALITWAGFRGSWAMIAAIVLLSLPLLVIVLLRGHDERHAAWSARMKEAGDEIIDRSGGREGSRAGAGHAPVHGVSGLRQSWRVGQVVRDPRFLMVIPAALAAPCIVTGIFFHQVHLVDVRGWSLAYLAGCFVIFAGAQVPASLAVGALVDRMSARRIAPMVVLPMVAALAVLAAGRQQSTIPVFMLLLGLTAGMIGPAFASLWAELYGTVHLGAIRGMVTGFMVLSTGTAPALMGILIERGVAFEQMFVAAAVLTLGAAGVAAWALRAPARPADDVRSA